MAGNFLFFLKRKELFKAIHGEIYLTNGSESLRLSDYSTNSISQDCIYPLFFWLSARTSVVFFDTPQLWLAKLNHLMKGLIICAAVYFTCQYIASLFFQKHHQKRTLYPGANAYRKKAAPNYSSCLWFSCFNDERLVLPDRDGNGYAVSSRSGWEHSIINVCFTFLILILGLKSNNHQIPIWKWMTIVSSGFVYRFIVFLFPRKWRYYTIKVNQET